jgi:hypothetical protein
MAARKHNIVFSLRLSSIVEHKAKFKELFHKRINAVFITLKYIYEPRTGGQSNKCAVVAILLRPSGDDVVTEITGANCFWQVSSDVNVSRGRGGGEAK